MKRKGRQHLPKVGTEADLAWQRREGVGHLEHPFTDDPTARTGLWVKIVAVLVVIVLVASLIGWLFIT
jgi:hypothetical protein